MTEGKMCAWCEEPAVTSVEATPARVVRNRLIEMPINAPACKRHRDIALLDSPPKVERRRKPGPEQTTIYDSL